MLLLCAATAQNFEVPALPTTKEEFIKSEPDIIAAAKWLEATPIGTQKNTPLFKAIDADKEGKLEDWGSGEIEE